MVNQKESNASSYNTSLQVALITRKTGRTFVPSQLRDWACPATTVVRTNCVKPAVRDLNTASLLDAMSGGLSGGRPQLLRSRGRLALVSSRTSATQSEPTAELCRQPDLSSNALVAQGLERSIADRQVPRSNRGQSSPKCDVFMALRSFAGGVGGGGSFLFYGVYILPGADSGVNGYGLISAVHDLSFTVG